MKTMKQEILQAYGWNVIRATNDSVTAICDGIYVYADNSKVLVNGAKYHSYIIPTIADAKEFWQDLIEES